MFNLTIWLGTLLLVVACFAASYLVTRLIEKAADARTQAQSWYAPRVSSRLKPGSVSRHGAQESRAPGGHTRS